MTAKKSAAKARSVPYDVHPSIAYTRAVLDNLPKTTGKSLDEWIRILKQDGPSEEREQREWLKKQFKLGGTTTWLITEKAAGIQSDATDPAAYLAAAPGYVDALYAGAKAELRPIHDALIKLGRSMGKDVKICPCETMVPLYREHVFAQIKPTTRTRIDFGLALKGAKEKLSKRLIDTGGIAKKDRITHRFAIASLADIDDEVRKWVKIAYELG